MRLTSSEPGLLNPLQHANNISRMLTNSSNPLSLLIPFYTNQKEDLVRDERGVKENERRRVKLEIVLQRY